VSEIILASQSPRRKQLLGEMGLDFKCIPSAYDEKLDESRDASEVAKELSLGKALDVARQYPSAYVIGSDTIVAKDGHQMEKPVDVNDARAMLIALSSGESSVCTGLAVVNLSLGIELVDVDTTRVFFMPDSEEVEQLREIYLKSMDWQDKAGGYGIQSGAAPLIKYISGDYDTVVGLPTRLLATMLGKVGIVASAVTAEAPVPLV
jgi:septum formation protein